MSADRNKLNLSTLATCCLFFVQIFSQQESMAGVSSLSNHHQQKILESKGMVWIPPGTFYMGCTNGLFSDAQPIHKVRLGGFWMDQTDVTNKQFAQFIRETKYITVAERQPKQSDFPKAPPENLVAGSLVFISPMHSTATNNHYQWWRYIIGASWQHPEGPGSDIKTRMNHPVVHVAWEDAVAYANWAGKRLPTEAEFEYAARGGLKDQIYCWGNELKPKNKWQANIWQGNFPYLNTKEDGYVNTSPVGEYFANGYGLYDMAGNVWQWCSDWYREDYYKLLTVNRVSENPQGPKDSFDAKEPTVNKRVLRGGSFLCADQYCGRFLVSARGKSEPNSSSCHIGFRCVKNTPP